MNKLCVGECISMEIIVRENGSPMKLIAFIVNENGTERELVRTERGRDNLLNLIHEMNLSRLTVTFE